MINEQDDVAVEEVLEDIGPAYAVDVSEELFDGTAVCECCGRKTEEFKEFHSEVSEVLSDLVIYNRAGTTADWKYFAVDND